MPPCGTVTWRKKAAIITPVAMQPSARMCRSRGGHPTFDAAVSMRPSRPQIHYSRLTPTPLCMALSKRGGAPPSDALTARARTHAIPAMSQACANNFFLRRPVGEHDHGWRNLPAWIREGLADGACAALTHRRPHRRDSRHGSDLQKTRRRWSVRPRSAVHPHDRHCRCRMASDARRGGGRVSMAVPIERALRHSMPPNQKAKLLPGGRCAAGHVPSPRRWKTQRRIIVRRRVDT